MTARRPAAEFVSLPGEEWREIPGFGAFYEASNLGRVRSWKNSAGWRRDAPVIMVGKVQRKYQDRTVILLTTSERRYHVPRAVLVLLAFTGPRPPGLECCHDDGIATNDGILNLRWDTHAANIADQYEHGTANHAPPGEAHHAAKLWDEAIRVIRAEPAHPDAVKMLARAFDVSPRQIRDIRAFRQWRHLEAA